MTNHTAVHRLITDRQPQHIDRLRAFMGIASPLGDAAGVRRAAEFLAAEYRALGCQTVEVAETPGLPAVWAHYDAGAARTLAVYGYVDTNSLGAGWTVEPYAGVIGTHKTYPQVLYGRGAGSKTGALGLVQALQAIRDTQAQLPVNLMVLIEGEEFIGSPNMPALIERYAAHLSTAEAVLWPGPGQSASGDVALYLGNKGLLKLEVTCTSEAWGRGPMGGAAHSSTQGVVDAPTWRLIHALATLFNPHTNEITVPGFRDGLLAPSAADEALIDQLAALYQGREAAAVPGIAPRATLPQFAGDISGREVFRRYCFEPTMNIDGLAAGMTGPDTPAWTLPNTARCTIDHRLPPGLDPQVCLAKLRAHLDAGGYPDIGLKVLGMVGPQKLAADHALVRAAQTVLQRRGRDPVIWPCRGTSGPSGNFSTQLGLGVLTGAGLGYASGHAGPDEFLVIDGGGQVGGLTDFIGSLADLVLEFAVTA